MSSRWIAAVVGVGGIVALVWCFRPARARPDGAPLRAASGAPAELQAPPQMDATGVEAQDEEERVALVAPHPAAPAETALVVEVTWARDGSPAADVPVEVTSVEVGPFPDSRTGTTDATGSVRFDGLAPGSQYVDPQRGGERFVALARGEVRTVALSIPAGVDVDCRVVDQDGQGAGGADVWLSAYGSESEGAVIGRTDARGAFLARDVESGRNLAARAAGFAPSAQRRITGNPGERLEVTLALRGPGAALAGSVRDALGAPVAGAELQLGSEHPGRVTLADGETIPAPPPVRLRADELGRFAARGLEPGLLPVAVRARGHAPLQASVPLAAGETAHQELVLAREARVVGTVRDEEGAPQGGVWLTGGAQHSDFTHSETRSQADGSFVLAGLRAGTCLLGAQDDARGRARSSLILEEGEEARWDPVLAAGERVGGVVLDERDAPLAGWHVAAVERLEPGLWLRDASTDASGRFELVNCPRSPFVLAVRTPEEVFGDPVLVFDAFQPGDEALVLRVRDADRPTASITGRVVSADGAPLVQPAVSYLSARTHLGLTVYPGEDGRFRIGPLRPALYALTVAAEGMGPLRTPRFQLDANEVEDVGTLVLEPPGWIVVRARGKDGPLPEGAVRWLSLQRDGSFAGALTFTGAEGRSGPLGRGTYAVRGSAWTWRADEASVEVVPGRTAELELEFEPAAARMLEFALPAGASAGSLYSLVRDSSGAVVAESNLGIGDASQREPQRRGRFAAGVGGLRLGTYAVEARTDTGLVAAGSFSVLDLGPAPAPIVFTLR